MDEDFCGLLFIWLTNYSFYQYHVRLGDRIQQCLLGLF